MKTLQRNSKPPFFPRSGRSLPKLIGWGLFGLLMGSLLFHLLILLPINQKKPIDGLFVLGGSIEREIHASQVAKDYPGVPILVSGGSPPPCAYKIFSRQSIPLGRILLEHCAQSTFDNFLFSVPILKEWKVHHIQLITSPSHLPRAQWLADIFLGSQGIAVEVNVETDTLLQGVGRSTESDLKSFLDISRSLFFALLGQVWTFSCDSLQPLDKLDITNPAFSPENWNCGPLNG